PAMQPMNGSNCMQAGENCPYGNAQCNCLAGGGGLNWRCNDCPAQQPMMGMACQNMGGGQARCDYGASQCTCQNQMWNCRMCPAQQPMQGMSCQGMAGLTCPYGNATCTCPNFGGNNWQCVQGCPANQPNAGDACMLPAGMQCHYGMTTCICLMGKYA